MKQNNRDKIPPSKKYGDRLMDIKKRLMRDVASYFDGGKFEMNRLCTLYYPLDFGGAYTATFDTVIGDENCIRLKREDSIGTILAFETDRGNESASADIYFLGKLADYMWLDKREKERKANTVYA
jgi:hypothetical protein